MHSSNLGLVGGDSFFGGIIPVCCVHVLNRPGHEICDFFGLFQGLDMFTDLICELTKPWNNPKKSQIS
jgi:hypothetical protein